MNKLISIIKLTVFFIPILLVFFCVYYFGVNIPYMDDWAFAPLLCQYKEGEISIWNFLAAFQNEHRVGVGYLLSLIFSLITNYNVKTIMYLNQAIIVLSFLIVYIHTSKEYGFSLKNIPIWFLPVPFLWFSWVQYENILWAFQTAFTLPLLFSIAALYLLGKFIKNNSRHELSILLLVIILALLSTFSSVMGLLVWPILMLNILISKKKWIYKISILIVFIITCFIYSIGKPDFPYTDHSNIANILRIYIGNPFYSIAYFISLFGMSANFHCYILSPIVCFIFGLAVLASLYGITVFMFKNRNFYSHNIFLVSVIIYGILIHIAFFYKNGYTLDMPFYLPSRYSTYNIMFIVAIYLLLVNVINSEKSGGCSKRYKLELIPLLLIFICSVHYIITPVTFLQPRKELLEKSIFPLLNYENTENRYLNLLNPNLIIPNDLLDNMRRTARYLDKYSMSIFDKNYLRRKYPNDYKLKYLTGMELYRFGEEDFNCSGKWDFIRPKDILLADNYFKCNPDFLISSRSNSINTGAISTKRFKIVEASFLYTKIILGANFKERKIGLDIDGDGLIDVDCEPKKQGTLSRIFTRVFYVKPDEPYCFEILYDLSGLKGKEVSFIVKDDHLYYEYWIMFTQPVILSKNNLK